MFRVSNAWCLSAQFMKCSVNIVLRARSISLYMNYESYHSFIIIFHISLVIVFWMITGGLEETDILQHVSYNN